MWQTTYFYKDLGKSLENAVELVTDFYYNFLLKELQNYVNEKYSANYNQFEEIFNAVDYFDFEDAALIKTFNEVGFKSYFSLFINLNYERKQEIQNCINKAKEFFKCVKEIENKEERLEEYFESFEQVGPYLKYILTKNGLIKTEVFEEKLNHTQKSMKTSVKMTFKDSELLTQ
ncbi:hypothetical protein [Natranaerobius trueperi]|uniref:Uncharacterized protein n=1 Tax=Natranaerobius trueperi TaxID=759412 RepID=A0A226BY40_9FIRM|nr:hypothetical protein [Natranaerobius trueperi]OWZ83254.1 hypothetical protein CDO51_09765 [Natranaerobius trueperi]